MNQYENITENKGKKKTNRVFGFNFDFEVGTFESLHENLHFFFYWNSYLFFLECKTGSVRENWMKKKDTENPEKLINGVFSGTTLIIIFYFFKTYFLGKFSTFIPKLFKILLIYPNFS